MKIKMKMRVVIGHMGTYLVPRLVDAGHAVIHISRAQHEPYRVHRAWNFVQPINQTRARDNARPG